MFFQQLVNGLTLGSAYAVIAIGYTLVFGVLNIVNMAHGGIFMIGAYIGLLLVTEAGMNIFPALAGAMIGGAVLGYALELLALRPLRKHKATHLAPLISTIGVSTFLESVALMVWGPQTRSFPSAFGNELMDMGVFKISGIQIISLGTAVVLMVLLTVMLNRTKVGKAIRATSENAETAGLLGINTSRIITLTVMLASALGAAAGVLIGLSFNAIEPTMGTMGSWAWWRSWIQLFVGCAIMGSGFVFFINPYNFVPGGVYGAGIVLHNIFPSIQVGTFGYMFDVPLMITAVLVFGGQFGARTVVAALFTPGFMNILTRLVYSDAAFTADGINLDPALLLGGSLNLSNDLLLTCIIGAVVIGVGQGMVVRTQATTGGTDIIAMLLQKYAGIKFSTGIFLADCVVILSGLVVIGFGLGTGDSSGSGWVLTLYSLITIFICSRVVARVIDGASYDKLLFIISDENEKLRTFILEDLERSATFIKARGMYSEEEKDMIFLVVDRKEVHAVQRKVQEIDPKAFFVVTDAYDTYGEGFKPFPEAGAIQAQ